MLSYNVSAGAWDIMLHAHAIWVAVSQVPDLHPSSYHAVQAACINAL